MQVSINTMFGVSAFNKRREGGGGAIRIEGWKMARYNMNELGVGFYVGLSIIQRGLEPLRFALDHFGQVCRVVGGFCFYGFYGFCVFCSFSAFKLFPGRLHHIPEAGA